MMCLPRIDADVTMKVAGSGQDASVISFEEATFSAQKNARFAAGIFSITGGDRGIRLHAAGRGLACKPSPSNPPRDVRRDIAGSA